MKKITSLLLIALIASASSMHAMNNDTSSESSENLIRKLTDCVAAGNKTPRNLLLATEIFSDIVQDESIDIDNKKIWHNWIIQKTNIMISNKLSKKKTFNKDLNALIESINKLKPTMLALPTTTTGIMTLKFRLALE